MLVPCMVQIDVKPLSCCHRMSDLPSPLKSSAALMCQLGPGLEPTAASATGFKPFISQIAGKPLSFCQRISALPSRLKSAAALTCHEGPTLVRATLMVRLVPSMVQIAALLVTVC